MEKKSQGKRTSFRKDRKSTPVKPIFFVTCAELMKDCGNPPLSQNGIKTIKKIAKFIPHNSPKIVSGIGLRHLMVLDNLFPKEHGRKRYIFFNFFFGMPEIYRDISDDPSSSRETILASGDRISEANYIAPERTHTMLKGILFKLPANAIICTDASVLKLLELNIEKPREGKVYRVDFKGTKIVSCQFFPR